MGRIDGRPCLAVELTNVSNLGKICVKSTGPVDSMALVFSFIRELATIGAQQQQRKETELYQRLRNKT